MSWVTLNRNRNLVTEWARRQETLFQGELGARSSSTKTANVAMDSRLGSRKVGRPRNSSSRSGRSAEHLKGNLRWVASGDLKRGAVGLAAKGLKNVPHWRIQEVGTGKSASMRRGASPVAAATRDGRPKAEELRIPSQIGRPIGKRGQGNVTLGFGPQVGGKYFTPSSARAGMDSVHRLSEFGEFGQPIRKIVIRRDIIGKHMVRDSGRKGFREYQQKVLAAGRDAFAGADHRRSSKK